MPRQRFYYRPQHPSANENGFVSADDLNDYVAPRALDAPIMVDRFYEGVQATDGTDIGSRRKRREYMKARDLVDSDDCKGMWDRAEKIRREGDPAERKARRELIGRLDYEMEKKNARRR